MILESDSTTNKLSIFSILMHALREFYSDRYNIAINKILLYGAEIHGFVGGFMHYFQTRCYFMSQPQPVIENKSP